MITIYLTNSPVITIYWTNDYTLLSNDNDIAIEQNKNTLLIYVEFIFVTLPQSRAPEKNTERENWRKT